MNANDDNLAEAKRWVRGTGFFGNGLALRPGPLPQGEGESSARQRKIRRLQQHGDRKIVHPLSEGEGPDEGEARTERERSPCGTRLDLAAIRSRLNRTSGQQYWRSLEEVADTKKFREMLHREFPEGATEWWDGLSRRNFLKMAAASLALAGLNACTKQPPKEILPYVNQPEGLVPGEPLLYATAMVQGGFAT